MQRLASFILLIAALAGCVDIPQSNPKRPSRPAGSLSTRPDFRQCLAQLAETQARYTPLPDQYYSAGCSTLGTVRLSDVRSDSATLGLTNLGPVSCPLASRFAAWARYGADRAAKQILGSALLRIETMGSYSCRNVAGSGKRSAHASAAAIDVGAFVLADGRRVSVLRQWSGGSDAERRFLRVVHESACKRFGTVLGPDYNAAHRDHLHVELSGTGFCR